MEDLTDLEKNVMAFIERGIPLKKRPFLDMANSLGISEDEFVFILKKLKERGIIRRIGAKIRHTKVGYISNVMVVWRVDDKDVEDIGEKMASFDFVSHCYERDTNPHFPYNLYTMIHGTSRKDCERKIEKISKQLGIYDYLSLFTKRELKKSKMVFFHQNRNDSEER